MDFRFTASDVSEISKVLNADTKPFEHSWTWQMHNQATKQSVVFTIYNNAQISSLNTGVLISAQTQHGYFELHDCNGYMFFEPDEIIFVHATETKVSCLIIGKQCTCSMYSNISREILNSDFSTLDPAVLLSAMQLSLTENILP